MASTMLPLSDTKQEPVVSSVFAFKSFRTSYRMIVVYILLLMNFVMSNNNFGYDKLYRNLGPKTPPQESEQAVTALIKRLIGKKAQWFNIKINESLKINYKDVFKVKKTNDYVTITGSSGVAAAWGFHFYLKEYCHCHISWDGDQINLPDIFPSVDIEVTANDWFRYYQNVCTTSYSFVWWGWDRWEREIDWMALNGFNLALAFNGQEEIWRRVYIKLGMTDEEIGQHFSGPAFLSWNRMGNMRGWGGPLSRAWHNRSVDLQKRILLRMRQLGITPVLPSFAGHVPRAFSRIFPDANMTLLPDWCSFPDQYCCYEVEFSNDGTVRYIFVKENRSLRCDMTSGLTILRCRMINRLLSEHFKWQGKPSTCLFTCPYLLSPDDSTFIEIGSSFLEEYIKEFGTDHIYNCDPFNEMTPSSGDLEYLRGIGQTIYKSINSTDPQGIWMLQGWLFKHDFLFWTKKKAKAFLTSIPIGKFLVLDLQAELNPQYILMDSFFGQPFIWCMLHNFGGTLGLHGSSEFINNNIFEARMFSNSTLVGVGITPEGINQNYVIYDLLMDMFWRKKSTNLTEWYGNYTRRRYGILNDHTQEAWNLLKQSVYNYTGHEAQHGKYTVVQHPRLNMLPDNIWYEENDVYDAWTKLLQASSEMLETEITETFLVDLVDVTRQALQLKINELYVKINDSFLKANLTVLQVTSTMLLELLDDLDTILASNSKFLLGRWTNPAKQIGTTPLEQKIYERISRNQITLWGPNGEIRDYANKQWSGLIKDYYKPRWQIFLSALNESLITKNPFRQKKVSQKIFTDVEKHFTYSYFNYSDSPIGDSIAISHSIKKKLENFKHKIHF